MSNVLVVDDELNICEGIRTILLQSDLGIDNVFTAHNGYEALDYLRMEPIDLMISDIRMDEMTGLELLAANYIEKPDLPIILISAYERFSYAQEAMRLGAKDYLVKPLDVPQLLQSVKVWLNASDRSMQELTRVSLAKPFASSESTLQENYLLNEVLDTPNLREEEVRAALDEAHVSLEGPYYCLMRVQLDLNAGGNQQGAITKLKDKNLFKFAAANVISETLVDWSHLVIPQFGGELAVLLQLNEAEHASLLSHHGVKLGIVSQLIHENIRHYLHIGNLIGISGFKRGLDSLYSLKCEAVKALSWSEMMPDQSVFFAQDFESYAAEPDNSDKGQEQFGKVNHSILLEIEAFLQQSYSLKGLKLQNIANKVHLSTNHISYLFRKFKKMTVWDYVLKLRMEQAKHLLMTTDMKRYEISEAIGYETPEHFSKIFKKYYGVSPSEIRG
ncbi:response regulator [Cohnella sp. GCM10020058]|uniref:response regulator n=1 Tax=Cohnella sp. GCM10020058 TaxID=3317330 RepID=UPI00363B4641